VISFHQSQPGSGPGKVAPDGSPVELYLRLSSGPAPAIIDKALPRRASILDLGYGTGAVAHELWRHGEPRWVIAVPAAGTP
jgi:hypothetical protein